MFEIKKLGPNKYHLEAEQWVPRPLEEVFAFFSQAGNLDKLTPEWVHFEILTPEPIEMQVGTILDYRIRMRGIPLRWQSEITVWEPCERFVDVQREGPYRSWHHEHSFQAHNAGTIIRDVVDYSVPLGGFVHYWFVKPDLIKMFNYRQEQTEVLFGDPVSEAAKTE